MRGRPAIRLHGASVADDLIRPLWIDNSRGRITTKSGQALADAVLATGSLDWLRAALGEQQR